MPALDRYIQFGVRGILEINTHEVDPEAKSELPPFALA
jgi:hypothetical protein